MRIAAVGNNELSKKFAEKGHVSWDENQFRPEYDLKMLNEFDVVVNCIETQDDDFERIFYINALTNRALSGHCKNQGVKFVCVSTGLLYEGENREIDPVSAYCNYTISKLVAEKFCKENDLIVRIDHSDTNIIADAIIALVWAGACGVYNIGSSLCMDKLRSFYIPNF